MEFLQLRIMQKKVLLDSCDLLLRLRVEGL
ncbi:hypothetical protein PC110_g21334 [Phytophthora cactorum]|uniref:Uncharacterized protein n=1 Tax=Phytophthora cactorum TaxID=29920 RepID=A0A329RC51_9STRA|nr:hypothetical protein PC110_g21334 [Phytophthora cactorum]